MVKGSSQSQTTSSAGATARLTTVGPRGSAAATAGMRRRRTTSAGGGGGNFSGGGGGSNMLRFYTDDAPVLKRTCMLSGCQSICCHHRVPRFQGKKPISSTLPSSPVVASSHNNQISIIESLSPPLIQIPVSQDLGLKVPFQN